MHRCAARVHVLASILALVCQPLAAQIPLRGRPPTPPGVMNNFNPTTSSIPLTANNPSDPAAVLRDLIRANSYNAFAHNTPFGPAGVPAPIANGSAAQAYNPYHYTWSYTSPYLDQRILANTTNVPAPGTYGLFPNSTGPAYYNSTQPVYTPPSGGYYNYTPYFPPAYSPFSRRLQPQEER